MRAKPNPYIKKKRRGEKMRGLFRSKKKGGVEPCKETFVLVNYATVNREKNRAPHGEKKIVRGEDRPVDTRARKKKGHFQRRCNDRGHEK